MRSISLWQPGHKASTKLPHGHIQVSNRAAHFSMSLLQLVQLVQLWFHTDIVGGHDRTAHAISDAQGALA